MFLTHRAGVHVVVAIAVGGLVSVRAACRSARPEVGKEEESSSRAAMPLAPGEGESNNDVASREQNQDLRSMGFAIHRTQIPKCFGRFGL